MGKAERRKKDQATAEFMRKHAVKRSTMNCPICHHQVGVGGKAFDLHLRSTHAK